MAITDWIPGYLNRDTSGERQRAILEGGRARADAALYGSQAIGNAVGGVANAAAGYVQQRQEQQALSKRSAQLMDALSTWDGKDPKALMGRLRAFPPNEALDIAKAAMAWQEMTDQADEANQVRLGRLMIGAARLDDDALKALMPDLLKKASPHIQALGADPAAIDTQNLPQLKKTMLALGYSLSGEKPETPEGFTLGENQVRFGADGKELARGPVGPPKRHMITVPGPGGRPIQRLATEEELAAGVEAYRAPVAPQKVDQPNWQWVNRGGKPVHTNRPEPGDEPLRAPRGGDPTRAARVKSAQGFLTRLNELRVKINTKMGPAAGVTGMVRRAAADIGMDPDVAEYEKIRKAGGRALAAAIMGAANLSDADADAWAGMLPDALTDMETAGRLTTQVGEMLAGEPGSPDSSADPEADALLDKYLGGQ